MARERRKSKRVKGAGRAALVSLTDVDIAECMLRDVSPTGALIQVEDPEIIPDYFKLKVLGARQVMKCRVRWREGSDMGIEFFGS